MSDSTFPEDFYSQSPAKSDADTVSDASIESELGDYKLVKTLGEGGMGVVYLAHHKTANRMVALKVIRPDSLHGLGPERQQKLLDRFRVEVQAAAHLDHNNIVSVYDVGEADGRRYFSMRYVPGPSLADLLADGPLDCRLAARYLEPVARAVHAAHVHGVLHRDIKPQNILIDHESDSALIADFGLAKLNEQQDELTRTGEVMGTPQYMSPEQATDSATVTASSDTYSLGATLYHLLTGRPAFQAATPVETLRQVLDVEPVAPNRLNPAIDQDLNTICLKCLAKDPAGRYTTTEELADELRRYLNGEPILARPLGRAARAWRWSKRNPLVASFALVAFLGLSGGLAASTAAYLKADAAFQRSEASLGEALDTVNDFFVDISEETLLNQPGLQPLRNELLKKARDYYLAFLEQRRDDPEIQDRVAEIHYRVGRMTAVIETHKAALVYYDQALAIQRPLVDAFPDSTVHQAALADMLIAKGEALFQIEQLDDSLVCLGEARDLRQWLHDLNPLAIETARKLANSYMNISIVLKEQNKSAESLQHVEIAQQIRRSVKNGQTDSRLVRDLAKGHYNIGDALDLSGQFELAADAYLDAIRLLEPLIEHEPAMNDRHLLNLCFFSLARTRDDDSFAMQEFQQALEGALSLAAANPSVVGYQALIGRIELERGDVYCFHEQYESAMESLNVADEVFRRLVAQSPASSEFQADLWATLQLIAKAEYPNSEGQKLTRQLEMASALRNEFPDVQYFVYAMEDATAALQEFEELAPVIPSESADRAATTAFESERAEQPTQ